MITPPYLREGSRIGLVAPARKVNREEMQAAKSMLRDWGLEVAEGKNLYRQEHQFAGTDEERAEDLQQMLDDPSVEAILCARGGYGTVRIIDKLDFSGFRKNTKWMCGFSDITVLHAHLHSQLKTETIHSAMALNLGDDKCSRENAASLRKALFGEKLSYNISQESPCHRSGSASGILVGGNLSMLYALTGTRSDIQTGGKILFLEDLDEYLYHVDRMMMNLKRSGRLEGLAGLIVGGMSDMKDNAIPFGKTAEQIIRDAVAEYGYPVCFNFPSGHTPENYTLIFGREVKLVVEEGRAVLDFSEKHHGPTQ